MANLLFRLGQGAFRRRRLVAAFWVIMLAVIGTLGLSAEKSTEGGLSMPGIESQRAFDLLSERFPGSAGNGASATIVFLAPDGQSLTASTPTIDRVLEAVNEGGEIASINPPTPGQSIDDAGSTGYATVNYTETAEALSDTARTALENASEQAAGSGLTIEMSGSALDSGTAPSVMELVGVAIAALVLIITFGSLVAAGLPLLTAILGVGISFTGIMALSGPLGLSSSTGMLALMLGLAVGIDYALFIVSRYREEVAAGHTPEQAAGRAIGTAGSAVVFAGLTVVIALAGLTVVGIPTLAKMGLASAGAVIVAVIIAITLVPALIGFFPTKVLPRSGKKTKDAPASTEPTYSARWIALVLRRPIAFVIAGAALLGVIAIPALSLQLGTPGDEALPTTTTERRAYDALADGFGPGFNGPLTIVIDARGAGDPVSAADAVAERVRSTDGIVSVSPPNFNDAGDTAVLRAVPSTSPTDEQTTNLVKTLRDTRTAVEGTTGVTYEITGTTALNIDVAQKVQSALVPYISVVVGLAVLLLLIVFRSIVIPIKAALGFLLSLFASLGVLVAVFQWGWGADILGVQQTGPIMSLMPILLVGIVFGLAMDYEVFLVSRMREAHVKGEVGDSAIRTGFGHSSKVVVAAAVIMIAVFAGFVFTPDSMIKMVGLGLAVAVFFDAFVVRLTLVPAVMHLFGERTWALPGWLDRVLPRVDVEGESLDHGTGTLSITDDDTTASELADSESAASTRSQA